MSEIEVAWEKVRDAVVVLEENLPEAPVMDAARHLVLTVAEAAFQAGRWKTGREEFRKRIEALPSRSERSE